MNRINVPEKRDSRHSGETDARSGGRAILPFRMIPAALETFSGAARDDGHRVRPSAFTLA
ncbi:hypothetical protein [Burkholderia sp. AW49-1]